jgi:hypothetical protein
LGRGPERRASQERLRLLLDPQPLADLRDEVDHRTSLRRFASRFVKPS